MTDNLIKKLKRLEKIVVFTGFIAVSALIGQVMHIKLSTYIMSVKTIEEIPRFDASAYLTAGRILNRNEANKLYDKKYQKAVQGEMLGLKLYSAHFAFVNPPVLAALYAPIADIDYRVAYLIVHRINFLIIFTGIGLLLYDAGFKIKKIPLLMLSLLFYPLYGALHHGQVSIILYFAAILGFLLLKRGKLFWTGVVLSLFWLKIHYVLFPVLLIIALKDHKLLKGFTISSAVFWLINFLIYPGFLIPYFKILLNMTERTESRFLGSEITYNNNPQGFFDAINKFLHNETATFILLVLVSAILIFMITKETIKTKNPLMIYSILIMISVLLNVHTLTADFVYFIIPLYYFTNLFYEDHKKYLMYALLAMLIVFMPYLSFVFLHHYLFLFFMFMVVGILIRENGVI